MVSQLAGGGVHVLPLFAQHLGDLRELEVGVGGVDLRAGDLHEAHVCTLGALRLVGVGDILALAAAALLLAILANLVGLLPALGTGLAFSLALNSVERRRGGNVSTCRSRERSRVCCLAEKFNSFTNARERNRKF